MTGAVKRDSEPSPVPRISPTLPRRLGTTPQERLIPSQRSAVRRPFRRAPAVRDQMIQARAGLVAELGTQRTEAEGADVTLAH